MSIFDHFDYVVGVDPGLGCTGLVILNKSGMVHNSTFMSISDDHMGKRLSDITRGVVFKSWAVCGPDKNRTLFCLEMNHMTGGRSAQSALKQRELIGCLRMMADENQFAHLVEVAPTSAKKALASSGRADKAAMVRMMLEYPGSPVGLTKAKREAVADALGAALAGAEKWRKENE